MKRKLSVLLFVLSSLLMFSQDYKQKITKATCECTADMKNKNLSPGEVNTQFGLCVIKSAMPYSKELKKEYGFDIRDTKNNDDPKMDAFYQDLSLWMMTECSDTFSNFLKNGETKKQAQKDLALTGTLVKIEKNNFVVFHITDENRNLKKLYWVSTIESNLDLPKEYNSLINKKVTVHYYTADIFDAKLNDYRTLNVISSLKTD